MLLRKIYRSLRFVLLIFVVLCVLLLCVLTFWVPCCEIRIQMMVGSSLPPVVCKRAHVLLTLSVFVCDSSVQRTLFWFFCVFVWFIFFVLCDLRCQFLCIVHFVLPLQYSLAFIDISTLNVK